MKTARILTILLLVLATMVCSARVSEAATLGTAFTYQGHLYDNNDVANDLYDFQFKLFDANSGGSQVAGDVNQPDVNVIDGYFTVELDFGNVFNGNAHWLEIGVRPGELEDSNSYTPLLPRQQVMPTPYAIYAKTAGGLDESNFWDLSGNSGTSSSTNFLGTVDDVTLEIRVNNKRVLRIEPDDVSPNIIGGFSGNSVTAGAKGATISGGGADFPATDQPNIATDDYCTVSGGRDNQAGNGAGTTIDTMFSTAGGGWRNKATGARSTIAGGNNNTASGYSAAIGGGSSNSAAQSYTTVAGGENNNAAANHAVIGGGRGNISNGFYCTVGGGWNNQAGLKQYVTVSGGRQNIASGLGAVIGGGYNNTAAATSIYSAIGGGSGNNVNGETSTIAGGYLNIASNDSATVGGGEENEASGQNSTIGGGFRNKATGLYSPTVAGGHTNIASGEYSMVPGGTMNEAKGSYSFAAGRRAKANNQGCFVWADSTDVNLPCNVDNRWMARASGGVYFYTKSDLSTGAYLAANSGSWATLSDRDAKENFAQTDARQVLNKLLRVPISTWNYKGADTRVRHMGPMAQDLYDAFKLGDSDKTIATVDADGVAFAAIQGLYKIVQEKDAEIIALKARLAKVEELVAKFAVQQEGDK